LTDNSIENRDIELDLFDKNPQRKDRTNSGGGLLIYSTKDYSESVHSGRYVLHKRKE
jgi:hypothetical protein